MSQSHEVLQATMEEKNENHCHKVLGAASFPLAGFDGNNIYLLRSVSSFFVSSCFVVDPCGPAVAMVALDIIAVAISMTIGWCPRSTSRCPSNISNSTARLIGSSPSALQKGNGKSMQNLNPARGYHPKNSMAGELLLHGSKWFLSHLLEIHPSWSFGLSIFKIEIY